MQKLTAKINFTKIIIHLINRKSLNIKFYPYIFLDFG